MNELIISIFMLLAGLGVLMTGMKMLSEGLERSAGTSMRKLFGKISNNRFASIGVGAVATVLVNSSAATTVMVIGFVNAGLMSLLQATAIIMGANIGTTLTGVIIALSGFSLSTYMAVLAFAGVVLSMASKNDKIKKIGSAITGLGLMFVGLSFMSDAFKSQIIASALESIFLKVDFPLVLILIGIVCTALFQSSAAMTAIVVTMSGAGIIPLSSALFVILGTNIGTCVTAILASFGASTNAKRTAMIHLLFNAIGTVFFTVLIWIFRSQAVWILERLSNNPQMRVALFHVIFNVFTTAMLVPFMKPLTRLATLLVREKEGDDSALKMYYIDDRILQTPVIAVAQVTKEVAHMGVMAQKNLDRGFNAIAERSLAEREKIMQQEEKIDFVNKGVARYLIKTSSLNLSRSDEKIVGALHHVISDIERIGDHAENFLEEAEEMNENGVTFSDDAMDELKNMYAKVRFMFERSLHVFENRDENGLAEISALESEVDMLKRVLGNNHIMRLNSGNCSVECGTHFYAIISALERVADHLTNIAFSIKSPSGSQLEAMEKIAREHAKKRHGANKAENNP
ncbi:Na/Pi cotransporter family protein [Pumilibacter intestinalis]|uniref:Na/Pi cotransporter family protein n=1 Tax=Pumilibacter intestinalis TaxID=2941511 RepID=UPI002041777C|nr:Na/Pi cotransporter family protein [Pumilibacter intestinalis]